MCSFIRIDDHLGGAEREWCLSQTFFLPATNLRPKPDLHRMFECSLAGSSSNLLHYFAMQTFFGSVKKRRASSPPSRPTPLCFMPPNGTRRSRTSQQFTQTVPVWIRSATRWARFRFCVQTLEARP